MQLSIHHAPAIAALHGLCFPQAWDSQEIAHILTVPGTRADGRMMKTQLQAILITRSDGENADILTLAVHPEWRRHGLARAVMDEAFSALKIDAVQRITLEVAVNNTAAIALYQYMDFQEIAQRSAYYRQADGGYTDAVIMQRVL